MLAILPSISCPLLFTWLTSSSSFRTHLNDYLFAPKYYNLKKLSAPSHSNTIWLSSEQLLPAWNYCASLFTIGLPHQYVLHHNTIQLGTTAGTEQVRSKCLLRAWMNNCALTPWCLGFLHYHFYTRLLPSKPPEILLISQSPGQILSLP